MKVLNCLKLLEQFEKLYRHFKKLDQESRVSAADIPFPDMSCDRARLSTLEYFSQKRPMDGVFSFTVASVPVSLGEFSFFCVEDPIEFPTVY
jgi:hypothetical protein